MSDLNCEYHSSRTAIDKCTRCNRLICLEDKNYISHGRSYNRGSSRYSYSTYNNIVLCSMCYYDAAVEGKNLMASSMKVMRKFIIIVPLIMILFPIFFIYMFTNAADGDFSPFSGFLPLIFLPFIIFMMVGLAMSKGGQSIFAKQTDQNITQAKIAKEKLMSSMDTSIAKDFLNKQLTCFKCGETIEINSLFCMNCGDSTKEERAQAGVF